jgi:surface protein
MFFNTMTFNQPLANWDVSSVTNMRCMFNGTTTFKHLPAWYVAQGEA